MIEFVTWGSGNSPNAFFLLGILFRVIGCLDKSGLFSQVEMAFGLLARFHIFVENEALVAGTVEAPFGISTRVLAPPILYTTLVIVCKVGQPEAL